VTQNASTYAPKIVLVGAGSTVFAKNLIGDIISLPELASSHLVLYDIDPIRLATSEIVAHRIAAVVGASPQITATTDRGAALDGADYVITMIQVGGYRPSTVVDFDIPKRFGLDQTIADTLGVGGIMRALRTVPVLVDLAQDMERRCPNALHINYANPMAMNCWGLDRFTKITTVGLCHSVPLTAQDICHDLGIPLAELTYKVAGINHMAFFLELQHNGEDLYPRLRSYAATNPRPVRKHSDGSQMVDQVRYEMCKRLGYFVTESSEHFSEYVPWFIKSRRPDLIDRFGIPLDEYPRRCESQIARWETLRSELENPTKPLEVHRSVEFGSQIIYSMETGQAQEIYGNVPNRGLVSNLPADCMVEVPCVVNGEGVRPKPVGAIPPHLAALMQTNINVQALTIEALATNNREHIYHAAMLDPHTASELDLDQIWTMVDELLVAHGNMIPEGLRS
jgi:alpha-galactosidase